MSHGFCRSALIIIIGTLLFFALFTFSLSAGSRCATCTRTSAGRIKRSSSAKRRFQKANPCPSTGQRTGRCPGYVMDHIKPLKRGGADAPSNMQWQTKEAAKAKDRIED